MPIADIKSTNGDVVAKATYDILTKTYTFVTDYVNDKILTDNFHYHYLQTEQRHLNQEHMMQILILRMKCLIIKLLITIVHQLQELISQMARTFLLKLLVDTASGQNTYKANGIC